MGTYQVRGTNNDDRNLHANHAIGQRKMLASNERTGPAADSQYLQEKSRIDPGIELAPHCRQVRHLLKTKLHM